MLVIVMAPVSLAADADGEKWTFMVYMDGDNNLETYAQLNLDWLMVTGSDSNVNFVVLLDTYGEGEEADLLYVEEGKCTPVGEDYGYPREVNMADPAVLEEFIEICCKDFAADKYALILWDHGGGWRGLCWDDTSAEEGEDDFMDMLELREGIYSAYNATGEVMDVIGFDLCLMAMPEVAYQVRGLADYVVFSEETVPAAGFPYKPIAANLVLDADMEPTELCEMIVAEYDAYYAPIGGYYTYTLSAFDMRYMSDLENTVDTLGTELLRGLVDYMQYYQMDVYGAQRYYYPYNVDLKGFCENLVNDKQIDDKAIKDAARDVIDVVEASVFATVNGLNSEGSYGIAIYIPSTNEGMHHIKDTYDGVPFALDTSWYEFVDAFSHFYGRTWGVP
jgi:hypothetical protein